MKKMCLTFLAALLVALTLLPFVASAAEVKYWEYKGHGNWTLGGHTTEIIYAQASVGKYPLYIIYAGSYDEWYMSFSYMNDDGFPIVNEEGRRPTFFVRTSPGLGSGRYDSDHEIDRDSAVIEENGVYSFSMALNPDDLQALKSDLDIGADYWLDDGTPTNLWRTFRFPGKGAAAAIARIEAEIADGMPATRAPVLAWKIINDADGNPVGYVEDDDGAASIGLQWISQDNWLLTFENKPSLATSLYMLSMPVPGTDYTRALSCGAEYQADGDVRRCFGADDIGLDGVISMLLDDNDAELLARADFVQIETRGPKVFTVFSLEGSAAAIAEIKRYHKVADRPAAPSDDLKAYRDRIRGFLEGFGFPDHLCNEPTAPLTLNPSQAVIDTANRDYGAFVDCLNTGKEKDIQAIAELVIALGGNYESSTDIWGVPAKCACEERVVSYFEVARLRWTARMAAHDAVIQLTRDLNEARERNSASDAKAAIARHNPVVAQVMPGLIDAIFGVSDAVRAIYNKRGNDFSPQVFREIRYR